MTDMEPAAGTEPTADAASERRFGRPSRAGGGRERMTERAGTRRATAGTWPATERGGTRRATETEPDSEGPLSARDALALIEAQHERTARSLHVDVPLIFILWGIAWLGGFGITYFSYGPAGRPGVPEWLAITVTVVLNVVAAATSAGQAVRRGHGVEGPSRQVMVMYMWAWPLAFGGLLAVNAGLFAQGAPLRLAPLLWPASATVVAGILYLATGFLFRDPSAYRLGAWMLIVGPASVFAGAPGNFAVLALAGGGGFLAAAAPYAWRRRRSPA